MKLVWTEPARNDLRAIVAYITEQNPHAARRLVKRIQQKARALQDNPTPGRLGRVGGTRELVLSGTHYLLPYRITEQNIQILAVLHGGTTMA